MNKVRAWSVVLGCVAIGCAGAVVAPKTISSAAPKSSASSSDAVPSPSTSAPVASASSVSPFDGIAPPTKQPRSLSPAFVQSNTTFALALLRKLDPKATSNVVFSPSSISAALAMTYAGAKGKTATEMAKAMHFDLPPDDLHASFATLNEMLDAKGGDDPELHVAHRLFFDKTTKLDGAFEKLLHEDYAAGVGPVNFKGDPEGARGTVNDWVKEATKGLIPQILGPKSVKSDQRMLVADAIYFKGKWTQQFSPGETAPKPFAVPIGKPKNVPTMYAHENDYPYWETADLQIVSLPYRSAKDGAHATSMIIVLPRATEGLAKLEATLDADALNGLLKNSRVLGVHLSLPKFVTTYSKQLPAILKPDMPSAFDAGKADFSGITTDDKIFLSQVVHQAHIEVDEEGTVAAAATAVGGVVLTSAKITATFKADHPFLYAIRDDATGAILFLGHVVDPSMK